ncbi:amino acid adenylation domain-containing protein [Sphaerisporangium aureirubrum]|uniref:Amino acid adenylation domain-containing protein n=1 Tax=Sphaerisporangium aureirubrum TaxID=1544736 RepID=A0ABW1ND61_9ACTN
MREQIPLSYGQERLWFLDQLQPGDPSHHLFSTLRLSGPLDVETLERALGEVVSRHAPLRARFPVRDGGPAQTAEPPGTFAVERADLTPDEVPAFLAERTNRPFDLAAGPPLRAAVATLGPHDHVLCLVVHHIVCDGWSLKLLLDEVARLYAAFTEGKPSPLPPLPAVFADFTRAQREHFGDSGAGDLPGGRDEALAYWRERLAGARPLELPTDRPRPPMATTNGAALVVPLPDGLMNGVRRLAAAERCTAFMVLMAAYQALLSRYSGQDDLCVGSAVAGRDRLEYEPLIGYFSGTLVLRGDLSGDPAFRELLARTRAAALDAYRHQHVPFERLLAELGVERDLSRPPLFQTMLVLHDMGESRLALPGVRAEVLDAGYLQVHHDLVLDVFGEDGGRRLVLTYNTDLFDRETAEGYASAYLSLLARAVADPAAPLSGLLAVDAAERETLLRQGGHPPVPPDGLPTVVGMFTRHAATTPDAVALVAPAPESREFPGAAVSPGSAATAGSAESAATPGSPASAATPGSHAGSARPSWWSADGEVALTYAEVARAADGVARRLLRAGAGRGSVVAVFAERSVATVAGFLGTMRAGAAYLPLDPGYPPDRIAMVLGDSGAAVVLVQPDLAHLLPPHDALVIPLDPGTADDSADLADHGDVLAPDPRPVDRLPEGPRPDDPAYVLYTSGSTGRPKGVVVPHRALTAFLLAMRDLLGAARDDVWLAVTSTSFDISGLEMYLPLVTGARAVVAGPGVARDGAALARLIEDGGVTHVQLTPSGWRVLLAAGFTGPRLSALVGGEALPRPLAAELRAKVGRLWNMYGPTETTIWSTAWEVPRDPAAVSIGAPIAGTSVHVVDRHLDLVPPGVPGELVIGGAGVADGYLGRPGLTAERFAPDPFGPPGARLYRTGDTVRRRAGGALEFLGRSDGQVKLRGHRIELGEIEAALESQPGVRQAAVAVRDQTLVAYVVGEPDRDALAARLPSFMVPAVFVAMERLPLTPNGKLDRRALPAPAPVEPGGGRPPATPAERLIAAVFAEVLGLDHPGAPPVGADDDFFALGGHSLLATKVVARVADALGVRVPVRELFAGPTVAALAAAAGRAEESSAPYEPRPAGVPAPLSAAQERLWFLHRFDPGDASWNVYLVRRIRGPLDPHVLDGALTLLAARHEGLRTRYPHDDGRPLAVVEPPSTTRFERVEADGEEAAREAVAARVNAPFDLTAAAPLRAALIRLSPADHVLCLVTHHIAADGWSLNVLFDDLSRLYGAGRRRVDGDPLPPPLQPGDIAYRERLREDSGRHEESLAYWRERLRGLPALDLPADRPRGDAAVRPAGHHRVTIPGHLAAALERTGREHGATLFMVLLAAYQVLLARHSGQKDFAVGSPTAGRDRVELERVVGYLTDTMVLRADLSGDPPFSASLAAVRESVLDAHTHRAVPFERLPGLLEAGRDTSRTPLFQTMFILHSEESGAREPFDGLPSEPFEARNDHVKLDLALDAWRHAEGVTLEFAYDAALFEAATVADMAARLAVLLEAVAADPGTPVTALPLRTPADDAALSLPPVTALSPGDGVPSPGVERVWPDAPTVPAMIAGTVRRAPDAVAVECGTERLTYARLDARARRLAALLRGHETVGVCLGRSPASVVALLAVWHAGAAYLPLDPEHPAGRLSALIRDAGLRLVVTDHETRHLSLPGVVTVDVNEAEHTAGPDQTPPGASGPHAPVGAAGPEERDAAYVLYTSGSTGVPKGVVVEHGNLASRVRWMRSAYGLGPGDRVVQFASLGFDTHAEEIHPALAAGATVVTLPDGGATLPDVLAATPGITVLDLPTAYWHRLVELIDEIRWPAALRLVILGGEQAHAAAVSRWRARFGGRVRLLNTYGPTETTVIATAAELGDDPGPRPPIGRPIAETTVHVMDERGEPVPPGVPGELYVGGAGVARGYLGRPALTAERFATDPAGPPGARLYRTGDRVRLRRDGRLEFLGRLDDQIKVRGHRVEPAEVEARLRACPGAGEVAVVVRDDTLLAYVTGPAPVEELRAHAAAALPPYMVPGVWTRLGHLPLTPNGKVDRAALPDPEPERDAPPVPPRTDAEQLIAEVWGEVLGLADVGAFDDFFALGGHSLLAVQVTARLRSGVGVDVPIRAVFAHRTVAALAVVVEELLLEELAGLSDEEAMRLLGADDQEGL